MVWSRFSFPSELLLAGVRQDAWRFAVSLLAIALGVALGFAIQLVNRQANQEFVRATQDLSGDAHLIVRGPRQGFDEKLFVQLAQRPGIEAISPALELDVRVAGREESLKLMAIDVFRAVRVQPQLIPVLAEGDDPLAVLQPRNIYLSAAARIRLNVKSGDALTVQTGMGTVNLRVAGTLSDGTRSSFGVMDIGAAQDIFQLIGRINRIDVRLHPGVDVEETRSAIDRIVPAGVHALTTGQSDAVAQRMSRAFRINLNVLALVALFTGALLIYATHSISVQRREAQHALWRALGATRAQLRNALILEASGVGLVGGVLGILIGTVAAHGLSLWSKGDLGSGLRPLLSARVDFSVSLAMIMLACGVFAALAGAVLSIRRGANVSVAAALKSQDAGADRGGPVRDATGIALLVTGGALCRAPPMDGLPVFGYLAIAVLLLGTIALMPRIAQSLLRWVPVDASLQWSLPAAQLRASLRQIALSLAATVAAVSLSVAMAIMVASFRHSLNEWLDSMLPAELYVRAGQPNDSAFIDDAAQQRMRELTGVARIQFQRAQQLLLRADLPRVTILARDLQEGAVRPRLPTVGPTRLTNDASREVWVSEIAAALHGYQTGDRIAIPLSGNNVEFTVAGIWRDYARQQGSLLIDRATYLRLTGDTQVNDAAIWLQPGTSVDAMTTALRRLAPDERLEIASAQALRKLSLTIFDRTFAVTYALEAVAIVIGLVGLSSSVGALVLARRREFGVLRHLGFTRGQIRWLLTVEGMMTTGTGIVAGGALGWVMSWILIHVVNEQSFHWSMDLSMPWVPLLLFGLSLLLLSTLTSWWSARQALSGNVVGAVKHDW